MRTTRIVRDLTLLFIGALLVATLFVIGARVRVAYGSPEAVVSRSYFNQAVRGQVERHRRDYRANQALRRKLHLARRQLKVRWLPSARRAIALAAIVYKQPERDLLRVATCETGGTLSPTAKNRRSSASGLYQFLYPSTWSSTPFARFSVWDPYVSALAAGWMWQQGRRGEWVCR